ncbi:MAG: diguanylate cyclase [Burkholderiaceae bacterium]|jgi:diguanylate cyclase (GGDEF)-like protein
MNILIVDDSATMRVGLARMIVRMGHDARVALSGKDALRMFQNERPDMILLDVLMDELDGYHVAREIRALAGDAWVPIIFLSSREEDQDLERGIEAGGDDYLVKPVSFVVLHSKIRAMQRIDEMRRKLLRVTDELEAANRELARLSHHDGLTGIPNRRFLDERMTAEMDSAQRNHKPLSVLLIDVDRFKAFNDHYGHPMGDACLIDVAHALKRACRRATDLAARYGGEEFVVLLPNCAESGAERAAMIILDAVRTLSIPHVKSEHSRVTVSVGVYTTIPARLSSAAELLAKADQALYSAKQAGRDQLAVSP